MDIKSKNIKSPKVFFEEKRLQFLAELEELKNKAKQEEVENKRVLSPKVFFNELVEQSPQEEVIEDPVVEEIDPYQEELKSLKFKIEEIENNISQEVDLSNILEFINSIKIKVDEIPKQKNYSSDIESIKADLIRIERSIPDVHSFDPSDLYENISLLKNKIEEVRSEIPVVPEPILYDNQLKDLTEFVETVRDSVPKIPEIKYYDDDLSLIIQDVTQIRDEIKRIPEVKYYDEQILSIENRVKEIQKSIPEVKYYDDDLKILENKIIEIKEYIPIVPEIKYYDVEIKTLENKLNEVKESIPSYDVEIKTLENKLNEVKESIPSYDEELEVFKNKLNEIKESIPVIPEIKYYDTEINSLNEEIKELYSKIITIKVPDESLYNEKIEKLYSSFEEKNVELWEKIKNLEEILDQANEKIKLQENLVDPPSIDNEDPLTPLNQNFVTLDQLQQHYKLFINRVQQQLATIGGGGETRLKYLDDIVGIATNASAYDGKFLKYNHSIGKFEFVTVSGGGAGTGDSYWIQSGVGIVTTTNVGINTSNPFSALTVSGDVSVSGIVTATDFNSASDIKLKENVSAIENPLDKIIKLEGVNFQWKESGRKSLGVIAQEVEKVLPELVSGEESKTVNYNGIIGLLIECVKEQQKEIEELKKLINK